MSDMPPAFQFDAGTFVRRGSEADPGEWSDETVREIAGLRALYPELSHWGDLAIGCAFGDFSQDVLEVSWAQWMLTERDEGFLNYCCWRQTHGKWEFGLDEDRLADSREWKGR